jgi:DNA-binding transcriptional regulator LsrR (DeoR family)
MPQKAVSMRKIKEVLRLRYDLGLLQSEIAPSCSIGQSSVSSLTRTSFGSGSALASAGGLRRLLAE